MNRKRWSIVAGATLVVLLAAFAVFRPDKLFVDQRADDDLGDEVIAALDGPTSSTVELDPEPDASTDLPGEGAPSTTAPAEIEQAAPVVLGRGNFEAQNGYDVTGEAAVIEQPDGSRVLVLRDLASDNGPDLRLYLSPRADGSVEGGIELAPLRGNLGTQAYELPAEIDLGGQGHVVIWCERFRTSFGTATLS